VSRPTSFFAAIPSILALAACSLGQQTSQLDSAVVPPVPGAGFRSTLVRDKDCRGVHSITVTPCPILLTNHTKPGVVVTVGGPDVVDSIAQKRACEDGKLCYNINRANSGLTQWRITSGRNCAVADIKFFGLDSAHKKMGYAFLRITNKYCP
jgi:hypothetical protein